MAIDSRPNRLLLKADHLLLDNLAVRPDRQRCGFGRKLIAFAEAEARRLRFAELRLYTHEAMSENIALYAAAATRPATAGFSWANSE